SVPITYRVSWTGNDGTFQSPSAVLLPLGTSVSLPLTIAVHSAGMHSAILNLHEPASDAIVLRTLAAIASPEPIATAASARRFSGTVPLMQTQSHLVSIPEGTTAMAVELEVTQGAVTPKLVPSHGLVMSTYDAVYPVTFTRTLM